MPELPSDTVSDADATLFRRSLTLTATALAGCLGVLWLLACRRRRR